MNDVLLALAIIPTIFVGMPWVILHYVTKWKTAATLTNDDEALLEELYQLARRLDERMDTVERLVAADNPAFQPARIMADRETDNVALDELDRLRMKSPGKTTQTGRIAK